MLELVAVGPEIDQELRYPLSEGETFLLGRKTKEGFTISWDKLISREHAEIRLSGNQLHVEKLPTASNPVRVNGEEVEDFEICVNEMFSIGRTDFRLKELAADGPTDKPVAPEDDLGSSLETFVKGDDASGDEDHLPDMGQYDLKKVLGKGRMGVVYLAIDKMLNRTVALKVLPPKFDPGSRVAKRFQVEAQALAQLHHANIVTLFEAGIIDDRTYLALEYVEGKDAMELLQEFGPFNEDRCTDVIYQTALALEHIETFNFVHRDIKPSNLLLQKDGTLKLADMGLARARDEAEMEGAALTAENAVLGTLHYISPEQARDSHMADIRSDIYSLGCTWYHLLTGALPFKGSSPTAVLKSHTFDPLPDPRELNSEISEATVRVMKKMTEKSSAERYQSATELLEEIDW